MGAVVQHLLNTKSLGLDPDIVEELKVWLPCMPLDFRLRWRKPSGPCQNERLLILMSFRRNCSNLSLMKIVMVTTVNWSIFMPL